MCSTIMVVEDELLVAEDLKGTLTEWGYGPIYLASSCDEALGALEKSTPDLVLMDIRIKGSLDGIATAGQIRERCDVPIVYLTAHADLERARPTQPYGFLLKPVKKPELRAAVEIGLQRHRSDRQLRERDRWYHSVLCAITEAVVTSDTEGRITFINPSAEQLLGVQCSSVVGQPLDQIVCIQSEHDLSQSPRIGYLHRSNGRSCPVSESSAPVLDEARVLGRLLVIHDKTAEMRLQKELELNQRLASLGTLSAGVAHEINNPLTVIMAGASYAIDILASPILPDSLPEVRATVEEIYEASDRIRNIVDDLRLFARPSALGKGRCDLVQAVQWSIRTTRKLFETTTLETLFPERAEIALDLTRSSQIAINLLVNAAHSIEAGQLAGKVSLKVLPMVEQVCLQVQDNGCGIAPEHLPHIFDPFFTTKLPNIGTGLGLSVVHNLIEMAGGRIEVESSLGSGSTFRVFLPIPGESV